MTDFTGTAHDLTASISSLDDGSAVRILAAMTRPHLRDADSGGAWTPESAHALCVELGVTPADTPASAGEIARHTLLLLAGEPDKGGPIAEMIRNPAPQRFAVDPISGTLLVTFALFALQSHVEFSRDKQGKWEFKFKKTPSKSSVVGPLIKKLVALISGGPPTAS